MSSTQLSNNVGLDLSDITHVITSSNPRKWRFWTDRAGTFSLAIWGWGKHPTTTRNDMKNMGSHQKTRSKNSNNSTNECKIADSPFPRCSVLAPQGTAGRIKQQQDRGFPKGEGGLGASQNHSFSLGKTTFRHGGPKSAWGGLVYANYMEI